MKTQDEVYERFVEYYQKNLDSFREEYKVQKPINCLHCLRTRKDKKFKQRCGLAVTDSDCVLISGRDSCESFSCKRSEEEIAERFNELLGNRPQVCQRYPAMGALMWVLQSGDTKPSSEGVCDDTGTPREPTPEIIQLNEEAGDDAKSDFVLSVSDTPARVLTTGVFIPLCDESDTEKKPWLVVRMWRWLFS